MKLAESLSKLQNTNKPGEVPTAAILNLTPHQSAQGTVASTSQDSSERASLNSKDSAELVTETLLDLSVPHPKPPKHDEESSDSDPLTSSSSECELPQTWEKFGDEAPPVPPPRTKMKAPKLIAKQRASTVVQGSAADNLGASIAETLYARGKDIPDSGTLFLSDLEFFKTLGLEKPSTDLPYPIAPVPVPRILTVIPGGSTPAAINPPVSSSPLVPTPVTALSSTPLVPIPTSQASSEGPLVPTPYSLVPLVPCPPVPISLAPLVPTPAAGSVLAPPSCTTAGVVTSSGSQNTASLQQRSLTMSGMVNGYTSGQRLSTPPPSTFSSPQREGSTQRLSAYHNSKSVDVAMESSATVQSRPPLISSRSTNPFSMTENRDTAQVKSRLEDPFDDLVKQTMAKSKEPKQQS